MDSHHCGGAERDHVGGRSRFNPALLHGLWPVDDERWCPVLRTDCLSISARLRPAADAVAAGCDGVAAATPERSAQHPMTAANRHSPATTAMADCHRVGLLGPRRNTVIQRYQRPCSAEVSRREPAFAPVPSMAVNRIGRESGQPAAGGCMTTVGLNP